VVALGLNAKMPEVCAAMGLSNLDRFDDIVAANQAIVGAYHAGLQGIAGVRLREPIEAGARNWQYVVLEVDVDRYGLTRDGLARTLAAEHVLARRYFYPGCHAMEPYRTTDPAAPARLPITQQAAQRVLVLPSGQCVSPEMASRVCAIVRTAQTRADEVRAALAELDAGGGCGPLGPYG
jgi:dTDP-4-amino-4,6-dideoxygalactose transaminase